MAIFPALKPSVRTYTPGVYPNTAHRTYSGREVRIRHSNIVHQQTLNLTFNNLTESAVMDLRRHYIGQQGGFRSFDLPAETLAGLGEARDFLPDTHSWIYASPPSISYQATGVFSVTVALASVPEGASVLQLVGTAAALTSTPQSAQFNWSRMLAGFYSATTTGRAASLFGPGAALLIGSPSAATTTGQTAELIAALDTAEPGGAWEVTTSISGGTLTADAYISGLGQTVTSTLNPGAPGSLGFDELITASPEAGIATTGSASTGLARTVSATFTGGTAVAAIGMNRSVTCSVAGGTATGTANGDPNFSSVSLLLHMDGSNDSTTIADSSSNAHTITVYGNAKLTTSDKQFGTAALTLDGSGDYITAPAGNGFQLGTGDFTVECWCKPTVIADNDGLFTFGGTGSGLFLALYQNYWMLGTAGSGGTSMGVASSDLNTWRHIAVTRSGTSLRLFIDGVQKGSTLTNSTNLTDNQLKIGYYYNTAYSFYGLVDEFRVTKGVARYTANFTPPSAAFPNA